MILSFPTRDECIVYKTSHDSLVRQYQQVLHTLLRFIFDVTPPVFRVSVGVKAKIEFHFQPLYSQRIRTDQ